MYVETKRVDEAFLYYQDYLRIPLPIMIELNLNLMKIGDQLKSGTIIEASYSISHMTAEEVRVITPFDQMH